MFTTFINAWKIKDVRRKLLFALLLIAVYRLGSAIPLPGTNLHAWYHIRSAGTGQTLFSTITGGGVGTIFMMGIGPFITASIIMQLLTVAIPKLEQMQKEGEEGRKKINQITKILTIVLAIVQGAGMVFTMTHQARSLGGEFFNNPGMFTYVVATAAMVAGSTFVMWMGELITEKGIGNGTSFIIFSNILAGVPSGILTLYSILLTPGVLHRIGLGFLIIAFAGLIAFAILVQEGERRIPVQYSKKMVGRQQYGGQSSYIPIKVNIAGVMSIIFAISIMQFPTMLAGFWSNPTLLRIADFLDIMSWSGAIIYLVFIVVFTFFYTSFAVNPIEMAENMKKNGGFIPGIRPGKPTSDYIARTVHRLSTIGAGFYVLLAAIPIVFQWIFNVPIGFGGTTLLIVTGVALEIVKQVESQLLMRHYKGFLS
ncbi:MAG: preprotein translocase subunit SecY [Defluviitaleaceae bacterium]|nr:preprotein translocase subunit SecY [Defluviitaleaceae bacterium]